MKLINSFPQVVEVIQRRFVVVKREEKNAKQVHQTQSHMPDDSLFYEKLVPIMLGSLAVLTVVIILVAVGIATGIIPY